MNIKKRMVSLLLVLALVVGICPAAFAGEGTQENGVRVVDLGHGEYAVANWFSRSSDTHQAKSVDSDGEIYYIKDVD